MTDQTLPILESSSGTLRGRREGDLDVFRGIPYAVPPVGAMRWRPPVRFPDWKGVRDAGADGPVCPQPQVPSMDRLFGTAGRPIGDASEDCLSLTAWTPRAGDGARRPVVVWIHGGAQVTGAGSWEANSLEGLARKGNVVTIGINYRIGPFGYLFIEEDDQARGNFWLDDQIEALNWVRENAEALGGDKENVTLVGQSGGARSIAWLMDLPRARPLFRRAILMSIPGGARVGDIQASQEVREQLFRRIGAADVEEARRVPAERLVAEIAPINESVSGWQDFVPAWWNMVDGQTVASDPGIAPSPGYAEGIDVMLGWTQDEYSFRWACQPGWREVTRDQGLERAALTFGDVAPYAWARYEALRPGALPMQVLNDIISDERYVAGGFDLADRLAAGGKAPYRYRFDWKYQADGGALGSPHCGDLPFLFDAFGSWSDGEMVASSPPSPYRQALAHQLAESWLAFARSGDPNHPGLPRWEPHTLTDRVGMRFDVVTEPVENLGGYRDEVWREFDGKQR